jgi:hypothetical protein
MSESELEITFVGPAFDDRSNEASHVSAEAVWFERAGEAAAIPCEDHRAFMGAARVKERVPDALIVWMRHVLWRLNRGSYHGGPRTERVH